MDVTVYEAALRANVGSAEARRLRRQGKVPGVLYGHGEDVIPLVCDAEVVSAMVTSGRHVVTLSVQGAQEKALIKEVQWDTWGREILHVDFGRVAMDEIVTVDVEITAHGTPKALATGAVLEQPLRKISVACTADRIPDALRVEVGHLEIGQMIHVKDLVLPEGVTVRADPETIVFLCQEARELEVAPVAPPTEGEVKEPEVIARGIKEKEEEAPEEKG